MLLPRIESESSAWGSRFRTVILTAFRCVFMLGSTATKRRRVSCGCASARSGARTGDGTVDGRAVLELERDRLVRELHLHHIEISSGSLHQRRVGQDVRGICGRAHTERSAPALPPDITRLGQLDTPTTVVGVEVNRQP